MRISTPRGARRTVQLAVTAIASGAGLALSPLLQHAVGSAHAQSAPLVPLMGTWPA